MCCAAALFELAKKIPATAAIDCAPAEPRGRVQLGKEYVNNQTLSDVTFLVEGKEFYAHRIALLASSDIFRQAICTEWTQAYIVSAGRSACLILTPLCGVIAVQDYLLSPIHGSLAETSVQLLQSCCTSSYSNVAFWASCTTRLVVPCATRQHSVAAGQCLMATTRRRRPASSQSQISVSVCLSL